MTEEELINLEVKASQGVMMIAHAKPDGYSLNNSELIVLLAEVRRLRGLIKEAEHYTHSEPDRCPWCWAPPGVSHHECPAFTQNGEVK